MAVEPTIRPGESKERADTAAAVDADVDRLERRARLRRRRRLVRGLIAVLVLLVLAWVAYAWSLRGEAAPGVTTAGVDVSGLDQQKMQELLATELAQRLEEPVQVTIGSEQVAVTPSALGITLDLQRMTDEALAADRLRARLVPFGDGTALPIRLLPPDSPQLTPGVRRLEQKAKDATLAVAKNAEVSTTPAVNGVDIAPRAVAGAVIEAMRAGETSASVTPRIIAPAISTEAAEAGATEARRLLGGPITLASGGKAVGKLQPKELAPAVLITERDGTFRVRVDADRLAKIVAADVKKLERAPTNAQFRLRESGKVVILPSKDGRSLDPIGTARLVRNAGLAAAGSGDRQADVVLKSKAPELTTAKAKSWGINKRIVSITTDLGASSANRVHNVTKMAAMLNGQVIPPGGEFSFNDSVGPRTEERGFKEGYAIVGGLYLPSIGGGVCQAATTIYDAAFYGGYDIVERRNHDFYISHYALGMDATVSWGGPDFRFINDSKYGILIKSWADAATMTVQFYSTPRGLDVSKNVSDKSSFTDPGERYILKNGLKQGQIVKSTSGAGGFAVSVERVIKRNGKVIDRETFGSNYVPEDAIYRIGPDTPTPAGQPVENPPEGLD